MSLLKNRTVIGVIRILLALIICFVVTPLFNKAISEKTEIVYVVKPVRIGEEIIADKVSVMEVGGYSLPKDTVRNLDAAIGKSASADLAVGDYIISSKVVREPTVEDTYLYNLIGKKQAISVSLKASVNGLSGKLQSGDIVSVIASDYKKQDPTVIPLELQYMEVIAVTANSGYDANTNTQNREESNTEKELPGTVTLLITLEQSKILVELEADGKAHISLVFRGTPEQPAAFIFTQGTVLLELYPSAEEETEDSESGVLEEQMDESEASETEQTDIAEDETAKTGGGVWESEVEQGVNFLRNSIFSRSAGGEDREMESENDDQMLTVWGSPDSGKTTTAVKLAMRPAMQKRDVALPSCDMNTSMLSYICPPGDLGEEHSLGSTLAASHVSESLVRHNYIFHKRFRHLTILGMRKDEDGHTYPAYERQQAEELLDCLRNIAPYITIDCGSYIANDILSTIVLMELDAVLRLVNCDLKSISYLSSQSPPLRENQRDADKQYKVASSARLNEASDYTEQVLGSMTFQLPHSLELAVQALEGNLFKELSLKGGRGYRRNLEAITREVFGCQGKTGVKPYFQRVLRNMLGEENRCLEAVNLFWKPGKNQNTCKLLRTTRQGKKHGRQRRRKKCLQSRSSLR